ncbi:hypothetical protein D3C79_1094210 [compost metagenome]
MDWLADQTGDRHFLGPDAVVASGLGKDGQNSEVEGVIGQHVGERHAQERRDDRHKVSR